MTTEIKAKINKLDSDLKRLFEKVEIKEKNNRGFFFEIKVESVFLLEGYNYKNVHLIVEVEMKNLVKDNIKWTYLTNPLKESKSDKVERVSTIYTMAKDILEVVTSKKMNKEYFESLEDYVELINENNTSLKEVSILDNIKEILHKNGILVKEVSEEKYYDFTDFQSPEIKYAFIHESLIKMADKFKIEFEINSLTGVNYTSFKDDRIIVDYLKSN